MSLSSDLISQFVKATTDTTKTESESVVYGTAVEYNDTIFVRLDGSDQLTPFSNTADAKPGDRVTVRIKNHTATVNGNLSSPSARIADMESLGHKVETFDAVLANKVDTTELVAKYATIEQLTAESATITGKLTAAEADIELLQAEDVKINGTLTAQDATIEDLKAKKLDAETANITYATIKNLEASQADIHNLLATYATVEQLNATDAKIDNLDATYATIETLESDYATIENLKATDAKIVDLEGIYGDFQVLTTNKFEAIDATIVDLEATKLDAKSAEVKYANIDFSNIGNAAMEYLYSQSGLIENVTISEGTITGELIGVTIKGDLIEGNTIKADKLVIKDSKDGLYYKLNFEAGTFTGGEEIPQDSLHGSVITAESITAEKISVDDLVAFDATIGGFNISDTAIYSGVKKTVDNTTRGIYLDNSGQVAFGDSTNFIKYYKDTDGTYKLAISAGAITLASSNKNVEDALAELDDLKIGARNLIRNSTTLLFSDYYFSGTFTAVYDGVSDIEILTGASASGDLSGNVTMRTSATVTNDGAGNVTIT